MNDMYREEIEALDDIHHVFIGTDGNGYDYIELVFSDGATLRFACDGQESWGTLEHIGVIHRISTLRDAYERKANQPAPKGWDIVDTSHD
jgi:hypothetical protein